MSKLTPERLAQSLDVSGAFDNCFFHTYATHLIANKLPFPEDLFNFKSIRGSDSQASLLQNRFTDFEALSLFAKFSQHRGKTGQSSNFIVEKTLVLGFLLREWFATKMAEEPFLLHEDPIIDMFKLYREHRIVGVPQEDLLGDANGVLYQSNLAFLKYFAERPKTAILTEQEQQFESHFSNKSQEEALKEYWWSQGRKLYCDAFATPGTKLSVNDVTPVITFLHQPLDIYYKGQDNSTLIPGNNAVATMEVCLDGMSGHYQLLRTANNTNVLKEYGASFTQYLNDREAILALTENKLEAVNSKSSLLVGAICPNGEFTKAPFAVLLEKIDSMKQSLITQQLQSRAEDQGKKVTPEEIKEAGPDLAQAEILRKELEAKERRDAQVESRRAEQETKEPSNIQAKANHKGQTAQKCRQAEAKAQSRKQDVEAITHRVDQVLALFLADISGADHKFQRANKKLHAVYAKLNIKKIEYYQELRKPHADIAQLGLQFKQDCEVVMSQARKDLAYDLSVGQYLKNLLKALANAIIYGGRAILGLDVKNPALFFKPAIPHSVKRIEKIQDDLDTPSDPAPTI